MSVSDLNQVELEAYQSEATGGLSSVLVFNLSKGDLTAYSEGAVFLGLHRQDATTQNILATFSPTVFSNDIADTGGCSYLIQVASNLTSWVVDTHCLNMLTESAIFGPPSVIGREG